MERYVKIKIRNLSVKFNNILPSENHSFIYLHKCRTNENLMYISFAMMFHKYALHHNMIFHECVASQCLTL